MRRNPFFSVESTHPHHRSGPIVDDPRPDRTEREAQRRDQAAEGTPERPPMPLPSRAFDGLLAAELAALGRRQEPGRNQPRSYASQRSAARDAEIWRDQFLAEIEELAGELKKKVARYALFRAVQSNSEASSPDDDAAAAWIHETLDDIAATALGMELASREAFLRASQAEKLRAAQAGKQDLGVEKDQEPKSGTTE
jgi:hypothetical protein